MPTEPRETEEEPRAMIDGDEENRFSQDDDDIAGRSWHGMNSEIDADEKHYVEEDLEGEQLPPLERIVRM